MKYQKTTLQNGLRVITVPMRESETAIVTVLVEAGSEYEDKRINGLSHFLEHMCFKGTKNRTGKQLAEELDSLGAENNAFTGNTMTGYWAKARYKQTDKIIDIIFDMYLNPTFPEKDIDIERGVILEEINLYEDMPMRKVYEIYAELLFGDQPAGRTVLGPKKNINSLQRKDFVTYYKKHYIPQKTVVVVAGNIDRAAVLKKIRNQFGQIPRGKISKKLPVKVHQKKPAIATYFKKTDQSHIMLGFRAFDIYDKRNVALDVASAILGGSMSSRLFKRMRDELGMCYYVRNYSLQSLDYGDFVANTGVGNARAEEAVSVIMEEFRRLRDEPISAQELKKGKDVVLGRTSTSLETSDAWATYYGEQELQHQKIETVPEYAKKIRAVTDADIKKALKVIMRPERLNLAVVGPQKNAASFRKLLRI